MIMFVPVSPTTQAAPTLARLPEGGRLRAGYHGYGVLQSAAGGHATVTSHAVPGGGPRHPREQGTDKWNP